MANDSDPLNYEETHVHSIYESIASHFSSTRYKPWPVVDAFLRALSPGSVGLDVGCGNGKYLNVNKNVLIVGSDRSSNLISLAKDTQLSANQASPQDVIVADTLSLPHADHRFDFAICIAVIHHLSSSERRVAAIAAILATLRQQISSRATGTDRQQQHHRQSGSKVLASGSCTAETLPIAPKPGLGPGQALIFVWALEQSSSRRGWKEGDEQDVLVPWVLKAPSQGSRAPEKEKAQEAFESTDSAGQPSGSDVANVADVPTARSKDQVFNRFYHLYRQGELESECHSAGGKVIASGYDRDNWWAIVEP